jgi:hypothetical protein
MVALLVDRVFSKSVDIGAVQVGQVWRPVRFDIGL